MSFSSIGATREENIFFLNQVTLCGYTSEKERFPSKRRLKLDPRSDGPFKVLAKVNDNSYKIDLQDTSGVSATINVADLQPYYDPDETLLSLRKNLSKTERMIGMHRPITL